MQGLELILCVAYLVLLAVCAIKESKVTGVYKAFGVYGRFKAYCAMDFALIGVFGIISGIVTLFGGGSDSGESLSVGQGLIFIVICLAFGAAGCWLYASSYRKCPDFLKKKCIPSMILTGLGVTVKILIFFIGSVWTLVGPQEMIDENGDTVYVYSGNVYSESGELLGEAEPDRRSYKKRRR